MSEVTTTDHAWAGDTPAVSLAAVGSVVLFFSGLAIYGTFALWSILPLHWLLALNGLVFLIAFINRDLRLPLRSPLIGWCVAYALISMLSYSLMMGGEPEPLRKRLLGAVFLAIGFLLFAQGPRVVRRARIAMVIVTVVSVILNAYDLTHPFAFVPAGSEFSNIGRAAGIYLNANGSGMAIMFGAILGVGVLRPWMRGPYLFLVIAGVLLTFSRGAMLGMGVAILLLWIRREIGVASIVSALLCLAVAGVAAYIALAPVIEAMNLDMDRLAGRLTWILDPASGADYSQVERQRIAQRGWDLFASAPIAGNGVGSTDLWADPVPTHNIYLMLGADFGALGLLLYPSLLWVACRRSRGPVLKCAPAFGAFALLMGLFDHDLVVSYALIIPVSLMAAMSWVADEEVSGSAGVGGPAGSAGRAGRW